LREEDVVVKQDDSGCNRDVGVPQKPCMEIKMAQFVTEPTVCMSKKYLETKMARLG